MIKNPSYRQTVPIWWSMFWRNTVFGSLAGGLVAIVAGLVVGSLGLSGNSQLLGQLTGLVAAFLVGVPVSLWAFRQALAKHELGLRTEPLDEIFE